MGRVMADVMPQIAGRADGSAVSQLVREKLGLTGAGGATPYDSAPCGPEPVRSGPAHRNHLAAPPPRGGARAPAFTVAGILSRVCAGSEPGLERRAGPPGQDPRRGPYTEPVQEVMDVSNAVAAELAGMGDGVLDALRDRLGCTIRLRGNQLTLEGDDGKVEEAREVIDELVELVEGGHQIGAQTVDAVLGALEADRDVRDVFDDVVWRHRGKRIAPKTVTQKAYVDAIRKRTVTFGIGPAGTGKTYLAMALAVAALQERQVARIILTRPAVEAGERLGFLPGDLLAKVDPYLRPLFDALYDMLEPERANSYMERGTIEVAPLAYMRGRTLNDSFIILDEAQNTSPEQMQMFLTRLGCVSKVVVTGDVTQVDLPRDQPSGLIQVRTILDRIDDIAFVQFDHRDVVRHKLVQRIVEAYREPRGGERAP